jgi:putative transposase
LIEWGVPERIKTDNGSDFRARFTQYLFNALGIEIEVCPPYSPQKKPHVERGIGTFQHDFCADLPGFIGHNVADRKVIEERRAFAQRLGLDDAGAFKVELTAQQFQARANAWAADDYATRQHSGIGCTPFARAAAFKGVVRRIDDIRAVDVLLAPIAKGDGTRIVTKRGIRIEHRYYLTQLLPETRVFVRMDPADMGRVWLFSEDGAEFLGEAICPDVAGIDPAAAVVEMRIYQKRTLDEMMAPLRREIKKRSQLDIADIFARQAAERAGKLVAFPKPVEGYTTPALEAAKAALGQPTPAPQTQEQRATLAEIEQDLAGVAPIVAHLPETKQQRFRRALQIEERIANNERISTEDAMWLGAYQAGPEYQSMRVLFQDFGEAALR